MVLEVRIQFIKSNPCFHQVQLLIYWKSQLVAQDIAGIDWLIFTQSYESHHYPLSEY